MEITRVLLDKMDLSVVKYSGIQYRDERKEYRICILSESRGHRLEARAGKLAGKCVRERIRVQSKK